MGSIASEKKNVKKKKKDKKTICPQIISFCPLPKALNKKIVCLDLRAEVEVFIEACMFLFDFDH